MQYMLLIYEDHSNYGGRDTHAWRAIVEAHGAYAQELAQAGVIRGGAGLEPVDTARTLRKKGGGYHVVDGPFAETKEQFGGYYLIEAPDIEAALGWARKLPLHADGSVEVRPVLETD
jgi:hypothetical protein